MSLPALLAAGVLDLDRAAFLKINGFRGPFLNGAAVVLSDAAYIPPVIYFYSLGVGYFNDDREALDFGKAAITATAATLAVNQGIKLFVKRERPIFAVPGAQGDYSHGLTTLFLPSEKYSCPSQSAAMAASEAMVMGYAFPHYDKYFYALMVLNGWSRVYKGAHYPGDVLLGFALGFSVTYGALMALKSYDADYDITRGGLAAPLFRVSRNF